MIFFGVLPHHMSLFADNLQQNISLVILEWNVQNRELLIEREIFGTC